jgi:hypothetical protein
VNIDSKLSNQDETIDNLKSDLQGFTFKHKQAVQVLDQKQQKLVDVMNKIEQENKKQITTKV